MTPEQEKAFEDLATRQAMLERRLHHFEEHLPRLVTSVLAGFFRAAAQNQVNPTTFEFALFDAETDDVQHSLQIIRDPADELLIFSYVGPDAWTNAAWIMKGSLIYTKAVDFMMRENLYNAHVKLVNVTPTPAEGQELPHE